mgnify:CR=1 FL=1
MTTDEIERNKSLVGCVCRLWNDSKDKAEILILEKYCHARLRPFGAMGYWWANCEIVPDDELQQSPYHPYSAPQFLTYGEIIELQGLLSFALARWGDSLNEWGAHCLNKAKAELSRLQCAAPHDVFAGDFVGMITPCHFANHCDATAPTRLIPTKQGGYK